VTVTHIFFNLAGTLVDAAQMRKCYTEKLGQMMAERFGGEADTWVGARLRVLEDWDSYFADLNFDGDEGMDDLWEGELRVTRALFRITGMSEPDSTPLAQLSRELPYLVTRQCDVLYPDGKPVIEALYKAGYVLGVATYSISDVAHGLLEGAGVIDCFRGPYLCPDFVERFRKDQAFFTMANLPPETCLLIDDSLDAIQGAKAAGMQTVHLIRNGDISSSPADYVLTGDLSGVPGYLGMGKS
jgi:FMN phosphatase YigB (HAD superfamily)